MGMGGCVCESVFFGVGLVTGSGSPNFVFGWVAIVTGEHQAACQTLVRAMCPGFVQATFETTHGGPGLPAFPKGGTTDA